jgi:hypothetical protein
MFKTESNTRRFGLLNLDHWVLPFDVAQGGDQVEPFRISSAFAEAATRRQVLRISDFQLLSKSQGSRDMRV